MIINRSCIIIMSQLTGKYRHNNEYVSVLYLLLASWTVRQTRWDTAFQSQLNEAHRSLKFGLKKRLICLCYSKGRR